MKINCYKFENKVFLSRTEENIQYDVVCSLFLSNPYSVGIKYVTITVDIRNVSDYELGTTPYLVYLLANQRVYAMEKSTTYKVKRAIMRLKLRVKGTNFFLDKMLRKIYPILRKKLIPISKNIDNSNQWVNTLSHFTMYFKNSQRINVQNWNLPIQLCYVMKKSNCNNTSQYYLRLLGFFIL